MLKALESRDGFRPVKDEKPGGTQTSTRSDWPDWRGPGRDGHVPRLPPRLPATAKFIWKKAAMTGGLAGLSVSDGRLILAERDFGDEYDVSLPECEQWRTALAGGISARGKLDYGQFLGPPVIHEGKVYLLGALAVRCVNVANGR
jgi:hypothetical protein